MTANPFFDTNVFLYAAAANLPAVDRHKRPIAFDLVSGDPFSVSGQVLAEFYTRIVGKFAATPEHASAWIERMAEYNCVPVDQAIVEEGISYSRRYKISYWDGAIIAAAHQAGSATLYSEDLNDGQRYGEVTVVNPFKPQSH